MPDQEAVQNVCNQHDAGDESMSKLIFHDVLMAIRAEKVLGSKNGFKKCEMSHPYHQRDADDETRERVRKAHSMLLRVFFQQRDNSPSRIPGRAYWYTHVHPAHMSG